MVNRISRISPDSFGTDLFLVQVDSPIGRIEMSADNTALLTLSIAHNDRLAHDGYPQHSNAVLDQACEELAEYFAGDRKTFTVALRLEGTEFHKAIWNELLHIGWGETVSYGELAAATGRPRAGRAAGGAVGANPIPLIVGCHRVLASDKKITGYSGGNGIPTKVWLLNHENIAYQ